jgi:hypothetical protein
MDHNAKGNCERSALPERTDACALCKPTDTKHSGACVKCSNVQKRQPHGTQAWQER